METDRRLERFHFIASEMLSQLSEFFKPEAKFTLLVRVPGLGDCNVVITDDDLELAIEVLRKRKLAEGGRS